LACAKAVTARPASAAGYSFRSKRFVSRSVVIPGLAMDLGYLLVSAPGMVAAHCAANVLIPLAFVASR
jgi:hypothetical protein